VKSLAEGLGGDVKMTSTLGHGTTATVRLPYPVPASAAGSKAAKALAAEAVA
jgi:signal transduction histidine kinase